MKWTFTEVDEGKDAELDLGQEHDEVLVQRADALPHAGVEEAEEDGEVRDEDEAEENDVGRGVEEPAELLGQGAEDVPGRWKQIKKIGLT